MPAPKINLLIDGERTPGRVLDQLMRLELRESDRDPSAAALRFNLMQQPDGSFFPIDDQLVQPGAGLAVELSAPGGLPARLFDGFVTHVRPHLEEIESNCYCEILAMDAAVLLNACERVAAYPDVSDSEAAEEIFGRYDLSHQVEQTPARRKADQKLLMQRGTDWQFLHLLARRNGYCCYFEFDGERSEVVGHFRPRALQEDAQADLTILREGQNLKWVDLQWVMTGPVRHIGAAIDPISKRIVRTNGSPEDEALGEEGLDALIENGLVATGAESASALLRHPEPLDTGIAAQGMGETEEDRFVIEARGELDSSLYRGLLRARRPVVMKGMGRSFSGTYYVRTVRTSVDEGTLTQTFIAERNALEQSGRETFGLEAEEVPAQ